MSRSRAIIAALFLCLSVITPAQTGTSDWPQWRGPQRSGISQEKGLLKQWPREAFAYPVIANGRLYIRDLESLWAYDIKEK